jgi:hypothetical protein
MDLPNLVRCFKVGGADQGPGLSGVEPLETLTPYCPAVGANYSRHVVSWLRNHPTEKFLSSGQGACILRNGEQGKECAVDGRKDNC